MSGVDDLVQWLRQQLDDDERVARAATPGPWAHSGDSDYQVARFEGGIAVFQDPAPPRPVDHSWGQPLPGDVVNTGYDVPSGVIYLADAEHIANWCPKRVLAEVETKRRLLDYLVALDDKASTNNWWNLDTYEPIQLLALPYADREGYQEAWRP